MHRVLSRKYPPFHRKRSHVLTHPDFSSVVVNSWPPLIRRQRSEDTILCVENPQWRHHTNPYNIIMYGKITPAGSVDSAWPMVRVSCEPVSAGSSGWWYNFFYIVPHIPIYRRECWINNKYSSPADNCDPKTKHAGQI